MILQLVQIPNIALLSSDDKNIFVRYTGNDLVSLLLQIKNQFSFPQLVQIYCFQENECDVLAYQLKNFINNIDLHLSIVIEDNKKSISICSIWPNAYFFENELYELFGFKFNSDRIYGQQWLDKNLSGHPMQKKFDKFQVADILTSDKFFDYDIKLKDPFSTHLINFYVKENNYKINDVFIEHGYCHAGLEKVFENVKLDQLLFFTRRLHHFCSISHNIVFAKTLEEFLDIKIPEKAMAMRIVWAEMARIIENIYCLAQLSVELDLNYLYKDCNELLSLMRNLIRLYNGTGHNALINVVGGIRADLPPGWMQMTRIQCDTLIKRLGAILKKVTQSQFIKDRMSVGHLDRHLILEYGISGPNARACGVNYDLRKNAPYYFYIELDFTVPIGSYGTVFDRMLVRLEESLQSVNIIMQVLDNLPAGDIVAKESLVAKNLNTSFSEKTYEDLIANGRELPHKRYYSSIEGSNGELGIFLDAKAGRNFNRVKFYSSSMNALSSFAKTMEEEHVDDLPMIFASLNISLAEVER